ncbi:tetratricopeptide repeat protein [Streptomyces sp. NPDC021020]|uniref:tetratricopeptide repeat protein n=1 Tax=Streptomyces sp. NPDC021020 TaxID=3365109 RepID=UPI0037A0F142
MDEVRAGDGGVAVGGDARMSATSGLAAGSVKGDVHIHQAPAAEKPGPVVALPPAPPVFVGRETEGDHILDVLRPDEGGTASVVVGAVAGLGGIGKTALALHAAHHAVGRGWFTDAVFVDLRGYDPDPLTAHQALDVLLRTLRVPADDIPSAPDERAARLGSVLSSLALEGRRVLIVADNASSSEQIRPLLPAGDRHRLLVTSRHTHPDLGARLLDLDILSPEAGADLIRATLEAARPGDTRTHDAPAAVLELAAWCGGLPLALRINAAALVLEPEQGVPELLGELRAHRSRIDAVDAYSDLTGTQRALRATFDLSHQHLPPGHRQLLHLLAIAPGPDIGLPAATALAGQPEPEVRAVLRALTRAHLLTHRAGQAGSRWSMHDLTRDHNASAVPGGQGADDVALTRLLSHYMGQARAADKHPRAALGEPVLTGFPDRGVALAWFDMELDNFLALVRSYPPAAAVVSASLSVYLGERRRYDEALELHTRAVEVFREIGDQRRYASAQYDIGNALQGLGRFDEALATHLETAEVFREIGDRRGEARALCASGNPLLRVGRFGEALVAYEEAVEVFRETGDRHGEGSALGARGNALQGLGRFGEALVAYEEAVKIFREIGDRIGEGTTLTNIAAALRELNRPHEAIEAYSEGLVIHRERGDRHGEGIALLGLGMVLCAIGRFDEALVAEAQAAENFRATRDAERMERTFDALAEAREAAAQQ